jgi:protein-tyrosine phosphatase
MGISNLFFRLRPDQANGVSLFQAANGRLAFRRPRERRSPHMIQRILIVCVGNICRSPMAEALLRERLRDRGVIVESAGLAPMTGNPVDADAAAVLAGHGLAAESHCARKITPDLIASADLVLAMDHRQLAAIHAIAPEARGRTFLLGHWIGDVDVPDPYGQARSVFEDTFALILRAVDAWVARL